MPADPAVTVEGLVKQYGRQRAVDGLSLAIPRGQCFGLLGPNGAGKTTALRLMLGLTPPTGGSVATLGYPIPQRAQAARQQIGVVTQADTLDPDFTVRENLASYARYFGLRPAKMQARIAELLDFAELGQRGDAPISALSGGMKRRLMLARALINDPALVVLDEPTTGLDPQARQHIWQRLRQLRRSGRTLLLTTHYMEEAERLCDRVGIVDHGRLIAADAPSSLTADNLEPHVLEVRGEGSAAGLEAAQAAGLRTEAAGDSALIYSHDERAVYDLAHKLATTDWLLRRRNLEDVFLRLTGRDLRD